MQEDGKRELSRKRPKATSRMMETFHVLTRVDYMDVNICQNVLSCTLKICAFYYMESYLNIKMLKKKKKPGRYP